MMQDSLAQHSEVRQRDDFVDPICADGDLLRAEFEAIVEAGWPSTPPSGPGDQDAEVNRPGHPCQGPGSREQRRPVGLDDPGAGSRSRQRSPPSDRC
jgi:hypothetical protein